MVCVWSMNLLQVWALFHIFTTSTQDMARPLIIWRKYITLGSSCFR
jgi:hypothetical protein